MYIVFNFKKKKKRLTRINFSSNPIFKKYLKHPFRGNERCANFSGSKERSDMLLYPSGTILNSLKFMVPSRNMHFLTSHRILQNLQGKLPQLL